MCKIQFTIMMLVSALMSTHRNESLGEWLVMHEFSDTSGSVACPFRTFRSPGEYDYTHNTL